LPGDVPCGTWITDDEPSSPITIVVCSLASEPVATESAAWFVVDESLHATNAMSMSAPAMRSLSTWAILACVGSELPLPPGPITNGEFVPHPPSRRDAAILREMLDASDAAARRAGVGRRSFLRGAGGVAAAL